MSNVTIHVVGTEAARLLSNMAESYGSIRELTITAGESEAEPTMGFVRVGINGSQGSVYAGRLGANQADAVARLRDLNAQYARGELTENPVQALREVMSLLDPAYDQLMRASG